MDVLYDEKQLDQKHPAQKTLHGTFEFTYLLLYFLYSHVPLFMELFDFIKKQCTKATEGNEEKEHS